MKVLILGSGGREHALAWAVKRSPRVTEVVCAPGNGGMAQIARCVPVDLKNLGAMIRLAEAEKPDLTIVGPELPLSLGIVDELQQRGLRVFGPTRAAATPTNFAPFPEPTIWNGLDNAVYQVVDKAKTGTKPRNFAFIAQQITNLRVSK